MKQTAIIDFQEKVFYHHPPINGDEKEWQEWMKNEKKARANHKRQFTKELNNIAFNNNEDYSPELPKEATRKISGVYKQGSQLAFSGDIESGDLSIEGPSIEADQEKKLIVNDWKKNKRGTQSKGKNARRRANKKKKKQ